MTFPAVWQPGPHFKQPRGTSTLKKEQDARTETAAERLVKADVRARDKKCRIPLKHRCRGGMEVVHLKDRSLGGAFVTSNLYWACAWLHRTGPVSIHGKDIEIVPLTKKGMDGPVAWYRLTYPEGGGTPTRSLMAREER